MEQLRMINLMKTVPPVAKAPGFTIRNFAPGDERVWTDICKFGLLEAHEDIECWEKYMLCFETLIPERDVFFVCDEQGYEVATFTAFVESGNVGLMHMLGARPEARGHGLGWVMTTLTMDKLNRELPVGDRMVRLKSDDWRKAAVLTYLRAGFQPVLFDVDMDTRWKKICDELNFHGVEMLDDDGKPTGLIL